MKYVILIHANPDPWGHPTSRFTAEARTLPEARHQEMDQQFEALLNEITASGEFVMAEALGDPATATLHGWGPEGHLATDGPYAETKEQLAGFFLVDCETRERAEELAARFAHPGAVVELRPAMWPGGEDR